MLHFCRSASAHTVLGRHGAINELYSSTNCKEIPKRILIRNVTVRGPYDEDPPECEFYYRFKYDSGTNNFNSSQHLTCNLNNIITDTTLLMGALKRSRLITLCYIIRNAMNV